MPWDAPIVFIVNVCLRASVIAGSFLHGYSYTIYRVLAKFIWTVKPSSEGMFVVFIALQKENSSLTYLLYWWYHVYMASPSDLKGSNISNTPGSR
jgi:hypothetical protein